MLEELTSFQEQVLNSKKYILLDFWAEWCAPCKALMPTLELISAQFTDNLTIYKINIDNEKNQNLTIAHQVRAVPTLALLKDGKVVSKKTGMQSKQQLQEWLEGEIE